MLDACRRKEAFTRFAFRFPRRFICFLISAPRHTLPAQKMKRARSKNRQKTAAGVVWLNARPAYCQRGEHRAHGDRSKHPFERRSGSKGLLPWVGSSFVERADEKDPLLSFTPFSGRPRKEVGSTLSSSFSATSNQPSKGPPAGCRRATEGFIIVHDKTLKMNMREVK